MYKAELDVANEMCEGCKAKAVELRQQAILSIIGTDVTTYYEVKASKEDVVEDAGNTEAEGAPALGTETAVAAAASTLAPVAQPDPLRTQPPPATSAAPHPLSMKMLPPSTAINAAGGQLVPNSVAASDPKDVVNYPKNTLWRGWG